MRFGVLFRGSEERAARKYSIDHGTLEAVIGQPANLFYGTGIPTCILVLNKDGTAERDFILPATPGTYGIQIVFPGPNTPTFTSAGGFEVTHSRDPRRRVKPATVLPPGTRDLPARGEHHVPPPARLQNAPTSPLWRSCPSRESP